MTVRRPIVAGRFYPASRDDCREALAMCAVQENERDGSPVFRAVGSAVGGVVPHAGWLCSGCVAARVFAALKRWGVADPATIVLVGAVHRWTGKADERAALFGDGYWETPIGPVDMDGDLARALCAATPLVIEQPEAHETEHSLEVQMPFVKHYFPGARVMPLLVPPTSEAAGIGKILGRVIARAGRDIIVVGTTDLTHYGPSYSFEPEGRGAAGLRWAKEINDGRMIQRIERMEAETVVQEAQRHHNACGAGAVACTIAASKTMGADTATVLEHTTSHDVLGGHTQDAVGYVGVLFGCSRSSGNEDG